MNRHWIVSLDPDLCSLCEMCVNRCPTRALSISKSDRQVRLIFDRGLCNGCDGEPYCQHHCPEKVIKITRVSPSRCKSIPRVVCLAQGRLSRCQGCRRTFIPIRKVTILATRCKLRKRDLLVWCPDCRRHKLIEGVDPFLSKHR